MIRTPVRSQNSAARSLGAGLVAGAAAGALWWAARRYGRDRADQILDWDQITSIALRTCAVTPPMTTAERAAAEREYEEILREISEPLSAYTGTDLRLSENEVRALDRPEWIKANVANFRELLRPFEELYRDVSARSARGKAEYPGVTALGRLALSAELGVLLGYMGRRVLGQYDISLLGAQTADAGKLYFVEPNIDAVQRQLGLPAKEFRTWLALHEATHAHEFEGHPWVRTYMNDTLQTYLHSMVDHLRDGQSSLTSFVARAVDRLSLGGTLLEAVMTPQQRELVSRLQALMCLLEGYGNHVMNSVGVNLLNHFSEIEQRVEARAKQRSAVEQLFLRVTGLQMKIDQYRLGEAFVNHVKQARGIDFMNQVWNGPEYLPTEQEIREPSRWVTRIEQAHA
jgi:coenzyme F420 biosynthesis associated uncharacterized protein